MTETTAKGTAPELIPNFDKAFCMVEARVERALIKAPPVIRGYTSHLAGARGKMIRAAALLACAQGEDGAIPADAVCFASGVELLHLATLVHDDVIDGADVRRGLPTLQRKFGGRAAVICGDYLLTLALRTAFAVSDREKYLSMKLRMPDYIGRVCMGELRQQMNNRNFSLSVQGYLRIIGGKTAALFEASFFAGAILSTNDEKVIRRYTRVGRNLGMIFQLTDDCIDFELDRTVAKKPVQSDYEQGVVTLPLIRAMERDTGLRARLEQEAIAREELTELVRKHGGLEDTRKLSKRYYDRAAELIGALALPEEKSGRLRGILNQAYRGPAYHLESQKEETM